MEPAISRPREAHLIARHRAASRVALALLVAVQVWGLYGYAGGGEPGVPHLDKLAHLLLFAAPTVVAAALRSRVVLAALVLHALVSEPLQGLLTTGRQTDPWDTVADLLGMVVGVLVARGWRVGSTARSRWGR